MTYAALTTDSGDLSYLNPPGQLDSQVVIAPCVDLCASIADPTPQGTPPEAGPREFSGETPVLAQLQTEQSTPETVPRAGAIATDSPTASDSLAPPESSPPENQTTVEPNPATPTDAPLENLPEPGSDASSVSQAEIPSGFSVFPVGIGLGQRIVEPGVLIRGAEDGSQALDFADWRVPYEAVVRALRLTVTALPDGQLEVRSPGLVVRLNPDELQVDPELGLILTIQEIEDLFGVPATFDINEYAIRFEPPWLTYWGSSGVTPDIPIDLEGLPVISPPETTLTQVEQRLELADDGDSPVEYRGNLTAVGAIPGASWFARIDQPDLISLDEWRLLEAQILRQRDAFDVTLGSQTPFWEEGGSTDLWGVTTVIRNGFSPATLQQGSTDPRQRLQSSRIGRTVTGEAEPGTLVRLTEGFGNRVLAEVSVDSSGVYRFDNVPFGNNLASNNYLLLLYPNGRLTELPEIRTVSFTTVGGQIPAGASAWAIAAGVGRDASEGGFFGEFEDFRGGATYRLGLSESTTVGAGIVYDDGLRGLSEIFFQPDDGSLQLAASLLTPDDDGDWDWDAALRYDPSSTFSVNLTSDPIDTRLDLGWRVIPEVELLSLIRTENPSEFGFQLNLTGQNAFTYARITLDTDGELRWSGVQRWGQAELETRGDDVSSATELAYNFSGDRLFDTGHFAFASYETRDTGDDEGTLTSVGWRYRSTERSPDGNYAWEARLGMGFGSEGSGLLASLQTAAVPGLLIRARYDGVSVTESEDSFRLEVVSSLRTQGRIRPGDRRTTYLRTQGGLIIEPFLDANLNGTHDEGEERYTDDANLLLILNNEPIQGFRPDITPNSISVRVDPGTYRLDLDPAGFPMDWQPDTRAMAVVINPGVFTFVPVAFVPSYTITGVATNAEGNPIIGARVEAVSATGERVFSVTNDAGVFYLEGLRREPYTLQVNGEPTEPATLELNEESEFFQELNLVQPQ